MTGYNKPGYSASNVAKNQLSLALPPVGDSACEILRSAVCGTEAADVSFAMAMRTCKGGRRS